MRRTALATALSAALVLAPAAVATATWDTLRAKAERGEPAALLEAGREHLDRPGGNKAEGLHYLQRLAGMHVPEAAYAHTELAEHFGQGHSKTDQARALHHLREAAALGDTAAQVALAKQLSKVAREDPAMAPAAAPQVAMLLEHAAKAGNKDAAWELAQAYRSGHVLPADAAKAREWTVLAAASGQVAAMLALADDALREKGSPEYLPNLAKRYLEQAAQAGSGAAMHALAQGYFDGQHWSADLKQADDWASRAKAAGHGAAQSLLAQIDGRQQSQREAADAARRAEDARVAAQRATQVEQLRAAAAIPDTRGPRPWVPSSVAQTSASTVGGQRPGSDDPLVAQLREENSRLRSELAEGRKRLEAIEARLTAVLARLGEDPDVRVAAAPAPRAATRPAQATKAPSQATDEGQAETLNRQGLAAFSAGDYAKAIRMFATAHQHGSIDAANNLGMIYLQGRGTAVNLPRAIELFRAAAYEGHATAAENMGYLYEHGIGVERDGNRALVWYTRAREMPSVVASPRAERRLADAAGDSAYY